MRPPRTRQHPIFRDERRKDTFRLKASCSSDVISVTLRRGLHRKKYWAILRGTGISESIPAIDVSYSFRLATKARTAGAALLPGTNARSPALRRRRSGDDVDQSYPVIRAKYFPLQGGERVVPCADKQIGQRRLSGRLAGTTGPHQDFTP